MRKLLYFCSRIRQTRTIMKIKILFSFLLILCCTSCRQQPKISDDRLAKAVEELWYHTEVSEQLLQAISIDELNIYDQQRYVLADAHLRLKRTASLPSSVNMNDLAWYFLSENDACSASEAYYIQGAYLNWLGENTQAMQYLKEAEALESEPIIRGMTYYKMGRISESEQLYDIALENYQKALPHLQEAGLPLYLASAYRELGRNCEVALRDSFFTQALQQASLYGDTILYLDIRYAQLSFDTQLSPEIAHICQYLCHEAGQRRYAYDLVKYYIRKQEADSARIYLDILAADTTAQSWSEDKYSLWHSQYLHLNKQSSEAYEILYALYQRYSKGIENKGRTSAYVVAQHYDNEAEHARNLQLQLEKQQLYIILALLVIGVLLATFIMIQYTTRRRTQQLIEKARMQQQVSDLEKELQVRREAIKRSIDQRIELNKRLQETILTKQQAESIPEWAKTFIEMNIFSTDEQWQMFLSEFNDCYGDLFPRLQVQFPHLTSTDLQVIALYILGMDNSDICLLMGLTQRTIWSRRMRIKARIGLGEKESLDKWIEGLV